MTVTVTGKPSCSDTLMPRVPGVSQQGAHEEAAPHIPHPDCSMGLSGGGWRAVGQPLQVLQVHSTPQAQPAHPEFVGLEREERALEDTILPEAGGLGAPLEGSPPPATNARAAKSRGSKGALGRVRRELFEAESWTLRLQAPPSLGWLGGPRLPDAPSPLWGLFDNINISVYFMVLRPVTG